MPAWSPPPPTLPTKRRAAVGWLPIVIGALAGLLVVLTGAILLVPGLRATLTDMVRGGDGVAAPTTATLAEGAATRTPPAQETVVASTPRRGALPTSVAALVPSLVETATEAPTGVPSPIPPSTASPTTEGAPSETAAPAPSTVAPTSSVAVTDTPAPTPQPTAEPAAPGVVLSFEQERQWRRGDEPYGEFTRSSEQVKAGAFSGRLAYQFPAVNNNYAVFVAQPPIALGGQPTGLTAWVYGDASGHFMNAWLQDATGEVRQYTFGRVNHQGWGQMTAWFDDSRGWPNGTISGSDNGRLDYPVSLYALLLDGVPDGQSSSGTIYLDDVAITTDAIVAQATPAPTQPTAAPGAPTQAPPPQGPVEVIFEYGWDGGWLGVENQGVWAAASNGHQYVAEVGFLSSAEAIAALKGVPPAGWKGKIVVRKQVGWVSCTTEVCQEHSTDGTQRMVTNQIYLRPEAWTSIVNDYLAGGWAAVTRNPHYQTVQEKAFGPIGSVPAVPVIAFRFTQME